MSVTTDSHAVAPLAGTWTLDPTHSSIRFDVLLMGIAHFEGMFRDVAATLSEAGLSGSTSVVSIDVGDEGLAGHLAAPDFFDAAAHPTFTFVSGPLAVEDGQVSVDGALELKGVRVPVVLTGTISAPVTDPWGNRKVGLTLATTIDRTDFGVDWNAPLPDGGQMLANEVDLTARLVFVAAQETEAA